MSNHLDTAEGVQEELSWMKFCPVCGGSLVEEMQKNREYNSKTYRYEDRPSTVSGKACSKGHGVFSVDYNISFELNKDAE